MAQDCQVSPLEVHIIVSGQLLGDVADSVDVGLEAGRQSCQTALEAQQ
jgi:hypothetical protein